MTALWDLTAHAARERLLRRDISSTELTQAVLDRIESVEPQVRAYLTVTAEQRAGAGARGRCRPRRR